MRVIQTKYRIVVLNFKTACLRKNRKCKVSSASGIACNVAWYLYKWNSIALINKTSVRKHKYSTGFFLNTLDGGGWIPPIVFYFELIHLWKTRDRRFVSSFSLIQRFIIGDVLFMWNPNEYALRLSFMLNFFAILRYRQWNIAIVFYFPFFFPVQLKIIPPRPENTRRYDDIFLCLTFR